MMIMNGINIYPAEIEHVLASHPSVRDVAAMALRSDIHQDIPICAVTLNPGYCASESDLVEFAKDRLGGHSPKAIAILESMPRNLQGKLVRAELSNAIMATLQLKMNNSDAKPVLPPTTTRILSSTERDTKLAPSGMNNPNQDSTRESAYNQPQVSDMRQLAQRFSIRLGPAAQPNLQRVDEWLRFAFAFDPTNLHVHSLVPLAGQSPRTLVAGPLTRALALARYLMEAARVPIFHAPSLLDVQSDSKRPGNWVATVQLAKIDSLPPNCYTLALQESTRIVQWMTLNAPDPQARASLYAAVEKRIVRPIANQISGGKSTLPVLQTAHQLGIPFAQVGPGVYQLGWGSQLRRLDRSTTDADSAIGSKLSRNKVWTASLLRVSGLPTPTHGLATTPEEALAQARIIGEMVVVKPMDGGRGEGVTIGVTERKQLMQAFAIAQAASSLKSVIIEKQVAGVCHRLFIAQQKLLYAVKRWPKSVHGDGQHTVAALIQQANLAEQSKPPWLRTEAFPDDVDAAQAARKAGFSMDGIPPQGVRVPLRAIESTQWGGFDEDVTQQIHPDNLDIALRASALVGLSVAGVDIITPDIRVPWYANGAIINEVNFAPLLGGGEISRRHIPAFLRDLLHGSGRIPVEAILGDANAMESARQQQKERVAAGQRCYISSHEITLAPSGGAMQLRLHGLYARTRALLLNREVDALLLVVQTDELLRTGMPVDRIDRFNCVGPSLMASAVAGAPLAPDAWSDITALLQSHCRTEPVM